TRQICLDLADELRTSLRGGFAGGASPDCGPCEGLFVPVAEGYARSPRERAAKPRKSAPRGERADSTFTRVWREEPGGPARPGPAPWPCCSLAEPRPG